jgi:hypothetical protein
MSKNNIKNLECNVGIFKVLKSDINLNEKNFIGFEDSDYNIVNDLNKSEIELAVKDNVYLGGSVFVGYEQDKIINKINEIDNLNSSKVLLVNNESTFENNVNIESKLFVKNNVFLNKDIFMPNPFILDLEDLTCTDLIITNDSMSFNTYKFLLKNILENTKICNSQNISSIKFFNPTNMFTQSIIPVNKKFIYNEIEINSFLLTYFIYYQNKIIEVKPIMDTFVLINNEQSIFKLTIDE